MSCNGCRVLRKGCSGDHCVLRQCLNGIVGAHAQGYATLFVAKFFGRATLLSSISAVPEPRRPALFQSLLFEAVGRTINPVGGVVGLLWTNNWQLCQSAVETVLRGGALQPLPELATGNPSPEFDNSSESGVDFFRPQSNESAKITAGPGSPRKNMDNEEDDEDGELQSQNSHDLDLSLKSAVPVDEMCPCSKKRRAATPPEEGLRGTASRRSSSSDGGPERREREELRLFI